MLVFEWSSHPVSARLILTVVAVALFATRLLACTTLTRNDYMPAGIIVHDHSALTTEPVRGRHAMQGNIAHYKISTRSMPDHCPSGKLQVLDAAIRRNHRLLSTLANTVTEEDRFVKIHTI